jgi:hypothetical protein
MAGRTARRLRLAAICLASLTLVVACGHGFEAGGLGTVPGAETPRASAGTIEAGTVAALRQALSIGHLDLEPATRPYQPAQPAGLISVPRAAYQVRLSDPEGGVLLVYTFADPDAARGGAQELADYLSSSPGKINFAGDTLFHVAHLGSTVILTWFSPSQSADPEAARGAFDLVSTVGAEVPVLP